MFEIGKMQRLVIRRINASGALLAEKENPAVTLLLPGKQIPENAGPGTELEVFIYRDSEDRLIATTSKPRMLLGEIAQLPVISVTEIGAFLDWGLEKDLFLPFKEQRGKLKPGMKVLAALYLDKSSRLCATMHISDYLRSDSPYRQGDKVSGTVYSMKDGMGAFVAVDNRYFGLIPSQELYSRLSIGDAVEARVLRVRPDGKLSLSNRKKAYAQMDEDAAKVMKAIEEYGGVLPFDDKADPETIRLELELSKNAFKRAVGRLLKEGRVELTPHGVRKVK